MVLSQLLTLINLYFESITGGFKGFRYNKKPIISIGGYEQWITILEQWN